MRIIDWSSDVCSSDLLPPTSITAGTGSTPGTIDVTVTPPTVPDGWVLVKAVATAMPDANPTGIFTGPYVEGTDVSSPYAITLLGLPAGVLCDVQAWLVWEKQSGQLAYSDRKSTRLNSSH